MPTVITVIYDNPTDPDAFEQAFAEAGQLDLAQKAALFPTIFGLATGGVRIVFADIEP